jgi:AraC-like DNA-binding protein
MAILKQDQPRGVLKSGVSSGEIVHARYLPAPDLAPFVEHYWTVEWDLAEPKVVETLPHPSVHLVLEPGSAQLAGIHTARFSRFLAGRSRVFGVKFRPGGFRPFIKFPVSTYSEQTLALKSVLGTAAEDLDKQVLMHADHHAAVDVLETFLRSLDPAVDSNAELCAQIVGRIADSRDINKVEMVATFCGIGMRRLQRLFDEYVGVSPKWVIQRYRLHEAAERIAQAIEPDWPDIALNLGYADQAHFIRDFRKLVGVTPAEYFLSLPQR